MKLRAILGLSALASAGAVSLDYDFRGRGSPTAVAALLARVLGQEDALVAQIFELQLVDACTAPLPEGSESTLCFEASSPAPSGAKVLIRGTSGCAAEPLRLISLASGQKSSLSPSLHTS